jgi:hypothetical protein
MFWVRKSFRGNIYGSLAPKSTLFARFWTTFAMRSKPRRISLEGAEAMSPSASGAIAGQKNRRKMKAPTAVNLASGNRFMTAAEICKQISEQKRPRLDGNTQTHNAAYLPKGDRDVRCWITYIINEDFCHYAELKSVFLKLFCGCSSCRIKLKVKIFGREYETLQDLL